MRPNGEDTFLILNGFIKPFTVNLISLLIPSLILASVECHSAGNKVISAPIDRSATDSVKSANATATESDFYPGDPTASAAVATDDIPAVAVKDESVCSLCCPESWRLSTNAVAWGMAITNLGVECDLARRWSVALSLYYSGWNYLKETRKFRTFIIRPEARYWFADGHRGFFAEGHLELAYYNFALPSWKYRIQDRDGRHPALGGGIGLGYRLPLRNPQWAVEAQVGTGVYHLSYDRFENRPDGPLHDTRTKTWFGVDNVSVGISFNFK